MPVVPPVVPPALAVLSVAPPVRVVPPIAPPVLITPPVPIEPPVTALPQLDDASIGRFTADNRRFQGHNGRT
jgi:hypothetical protein